MGGSRNFLYPVAKPDHLLYLLPDKNFTKIIQYEKTTVAISSFCAYPEYQPGKCAGYLPGK